MSETVLDVLMYLFDQYAEEDIDLDPDREALEGSLRAAGFAPGSIGRALDWLDALASDSDATEVGLGRGVRHYTQSECARLDRECRGFLLSLEQSGALNPATREIVIDRVMALDDQQVDLGDLKWIVLMVISNQPQYSDAHYAWVEDIVLQDSPQHVH
jgi:Smg protein